MYEFTTNLNKHTLIENFHFNFSVLMLLMKIQK